MLGKLPFRLQLPFFTFSKIFSKSGSPSGSFFSPAKINFVEFLAALRIIELAMTIFMMKNKKILP